VFFDFIQRLTRLQKPKFGFESVFEND